MKQVINRIIRWWLNRQKRPTHFAPRSTTADHASWQQLLQKVVDTNGKVDYEALRKKGEQLDRYCKHISEGPPAEDNAAILAYWINAYNAFTLQAVLLFNPTNSIREADQLWKLGKTVFDRAFFSIAGKPCSLNLIEHQVLRTLNEPRIHFAINCASSSCPALRPEAYSPQQLEKQLQEQTHKFLSDPSKNILSPQGWQLSPIFSWFADDFGGAKGVNTFIAEQTKQNTDQPIKYLPYDWSLNKKSSE